MQVVEKHGGGMHFVRPDRVYRTGVLSPWFTFSPGQDVQAVASEFTQRSMNLGAPRSGLLDRMRSGLSSLRARVMGKAAPMPSVATAPQSQAQDGPFADRGQAFMPHPAQRGMAYAQVGMQVAPHMIGQVQLMAKLTAGSLPRQVADAQVATSMERWHNLRWNG